MTAPVLSPRALAPDIPPALEAAILKLLAKNPTDRYLSAEEALVALQPEPIDKFGLFRRSPGESGQEAPAPSELAPLEAVLALRYGEDTAAAIEADRPIRREDQRLPAASPSF